METHTQPQRGQSLEWPRVRFFAALLLAFGPCVYFYANSRHSSGPGATFELMLVCWPFEVAAVFVAGSSVRRLKRARAEHALARSVAGGYLVGAWLVLLFSLVVAVLAPVALFFLFALSMGVAG